MFKNAPRKGLPKKPPTKRQKRLKTNAVAGKVVAPAQKPSSLLVQLQTMEGDTVEGGGQLHVPADTTPKQLTELVNSLLGNDIKEKFAFYVNDAAVPEASELHQLVQEQNLSTETVVAVKYQKLASFRVRAVSRCTDSMPGHTGAVLHVSFSPDGKHLVSGGGDCVVRFWDVNTALPRFACRGHKDHILQTAWSPSGKWFASGDMKGEIRVWDPETGKLHRALKGHKQWITAITWEPLHRNAAGERFATSSKDKTTKIWNVRTGRCVVSMCGHKEAIECVKWGGEGLLYTASRDRTINVWAAEGDSTGRCVRTLRGHAHRVNTLALSSDFVCRSGAFGHKAQTFKTAEEAHLAAKKRYAEIVQPPERLCSGSDDHTLILWSPTKSSTAVARMTGHQQQVNHVSFSPDGRFIASGSFDKKVKLWDGYTGKFINTYTGHVGAVYQVCWSPDSRLLASASKDSTVKVWAVQTANTRRGTKCVSNCPGHADEVYALDWAPNGQRVASGSKDRMVKMWRN